MFLFVGVLVPVFLVLSLCPVAAAVYLAAALNRRGD